MSIQFDYSGAGLLAGLATATFGEVSAKTSASTLRERFDYHGTSHGANLQGRLNLHLITIPNRYRQRLVFEAGHPNCESGIAEWKISENNLTHAIGSPGSYGLGISSEK
jgi:hypothetical protein